LRYSIYTRQQNYDFRSARLYARQLFQTSNMEIIRLSKWMFNFELRSLLIEERMKKY